MASSGSYRLGDAVRCFFTGSQEERVNNMEEKSEAQKQQEMREKKYGLNSGQTSVSGPMPTGSSTSTTKPLPPTPIDSHKGGK